MRGHQPKTNGKLPTIPPKGRSPNPDGSGVAPVVPAFSAELGEIVGEIETELSEWCRFWNVKRARKIIESLAAPETQQPTMPPGTWVVHHRDHPPLLCDDDDEARAAQQERADTHVVTFYGPRPEPVTEVWIPFHRAAGYPRGATIGVYGSRDAAIRAVLDHCEKMGVAVEAGEISVANRPGDWRTARIPVHGAQPKQDDDCDDCEHAERYERVCRELRDKTAKHRVGLEMNEALHVRLDIVIQERNELRSKLVDVNHHAVLVSGTVPNVCPDRQRLVERIQSIGAVGSQPESTEQDDSGELPGCPDCGRVQKSLVTTDDGSDPTVVKCDCVDWIPCSLWFRHVAKRTVCVECGELPTAMGISGITNEPTGHIKCPTESDLCPSKWSTPREWIDRNEVERKQRDVVSCAGHNHSNDNSQHERQKPGMTGESPAVGCNAASPGRGDKNRGVISPPALERAREAFNGCHWWYWAKFILEHLEGEQGRVTRHASTQTTPMLDLKERLDALEEKVSLIDCVSARTNKERGERLTDIEGRLDALEGKKK